MSSGGARALWTRWKAMGGYWSMSVFATVWSIALTAVPGDAQSSEPERLVIQSSELGEQRVVDVALPRSYGESSFGYPVVYVLDGPSHLEHVSASARFLSGLGLMPEVLVVSVHNVDRARDMTPPGMDLPVLAGARASADRFSAFLDAELVPEIDRRFRTVPLRILVGHSHGALFGTYVAVTRPDLFRWQILLDGPYTLADGQTMDRMAEWAANPAADGSRLAFFDQAFGWPEARWQEFREHVRPTVRVMRAADLGESHESLPLEGVYEGLKWLFSDYPSEGGTAATSGEIEAVFDGISRAYGARIPPSRRRLVRDASDFLSQGRIEDARNVTDLAASLYGEPTVRDLRARIAEAPADARRPATSMVDWTALASPTEAQASQFLGTWIGTLNTDDPESLEVTFEFADGPMIGHTVRPGPGGVGRDTRAHVFHHVREDGTFLYGYPNPIRPGGMIVYTMTLDGDKLSGAQSLEAVLMPEGVDLPPVTVELERR